MSPEERARFIERYRDAPRVLQDAVSRLSLTDLDRHAGQEWSAREVVHHVADAELAESLRLRRILAEEEPLLEWIDEAEHARRLHYNRAIEPSLAIFIAAVQSNAELAATLSEGEWQRFGVHSVTGRYSAEDWLVKMSEHAHEHAAQLLRAAGHKPL